MINNNLRLQSNIRNSNIINFENYISCAFGRLAATIVPTVLLLF